MVIDWVMLQSTTGRTGIQLAFTSCKQLENLHFAYDIYIALLSHKHQHAQEKLYRADKAAKKTRLKINTTKTEII
jgi:hypothetical protein